LLKKYWHCVIQFIAKLVISIENLAKALVKVPDTQGNLSNAVQNAIVCDFISNLSKVIVAVLHENLASKHKFLVLENFYFDDFIVDC